jgi:hypothetical protein
VQSSRPGARPVVPEERSGPQGQGQGQGNGNGNGRGPRQQER